MLNIAFFLGGLQLDSQRKVLEGIMRGIKRDGNNVYVYSITLTLDEQYNVGEYAIADAEDFEKFDGFIIYAESLYSVSIRNKLIKRILATGRPIVSIDCPIPGMINISSDNEGAMRELSSHLIDDHKIKKVNFIGGPKDSLDAITRKKVFYEEMAKRGLSVEADRYYVGDYYARSGRNAVEYYEKNGLIQADAYVCANDQMALGAYYALTERGYRIPEDIILTGYDDIFEAANHYPRITSVTRHEEQIGLTAYEYVVKRINGESIEDTPVIQSRLVRAESCGCSIGRPTNHRIVVNNYVEKSLREARLAEMVSDFSAELTSIQTYDEVGERLRAFIPGLGGDSFAICFYKDVNDNSNIRYGMFYTNGRFYTVNNIVANASKDTFGPSNGGDLYIISSIHFSDKCYGHMVIRNSSLPLRSEFYRMFAISLGSVVEHIIAYNKLQEMIKTLDEMWVFDPMTHIYNRAGFFKFANEMMLKAKYNENNMFLIFLDMDGLKKVNDVYGHEMGDKLICEMADVLRKCRDKEELLMRYGGDEFVIFGEGYDDEKVKDYVDRIRKAMREINEKGDRPYIMDASIGYSEIKFDDTRPLSSLIEIADQNMYREKRAKHKKK